MSAREQNHTRARALRRRIDKSMRRAGAESRDVRTIAEASAAGLAFVHLAAVGRRLGALAHAVVADHLERDLGRLAEVVGRAGSS